ncbi:sugar phosphate isomerase/epimerase family protein [Novosphingobium colocasiae]
MQLYTVRAEAEKDLPGVLGALATIGYRSVELAGLLGRTAREVRAALDGSGLRCPSVHFQPRTRGTDLSFAGDLTLMADTLHTIGADTAVVSIPYIPDRLWPSAPRGGDLPAILQQMTLDDWKEGADYLNSKAALLRSQGIRLGYHNHNVEFAALGDTTPMEVLLAHTDPRLVTFELDVGWAASAGVDPVALLGKHPERFFDDACKGHQADHQT